MISLREIEEIENKIDDIHQYLARMAKLIYEIRKGKPITEPFEKYEQYNGKITVTLGSYGRYQSYYSEDVSFPSSYLDLPQEEWEMIELDAAIASASKAEEARQAATKAEEEKQRKLYEELQKKFG
jgi:hypothetical protein